MPVIHNKGHPRRIGAKCTTEDFQRGWGTAHTRYYTVEKERVGHAKTVRLFHLKKVSGSEVELQNNGSGTLHRWMIF